MKTRVPVNVTEVRAFAGLVNYYSRFIRYISQKMCPIYRILLKDVQFERNKACNASFLETKDDIVKKNVLFHAKRNVLSYAKLPTSLTCDASSYGLGAVLSHILPSGEEKPVAFCSRSLCPAEKNYSVID